MPGIRRPPRVSKRSSRLNKAYVALGEVFEDTDFSAAEKQVILLTVSRYHECAYCMAAHSSLAQMKHVPQHVIDTIRNDRPIDDAFVQNTWAADSGRSD